MPRASSDDPMGKERKKFFAAGVAREMEHDDKARRAVVAYDRKQVNDKAMIYSVNGSVNANCVMALPSFPPLLHPPSSPIDGRVTRGLPVCP